MSTDKKAVDKVADQIPVDEKPVEEKPVEEVTENKPPADKKPAKPPKVETKPAKCGFCVYLGPSIRADIQHGTVYPENKEKTAKKLGELIGQYPLVKSLLIHGNEVSASRIKIQTPGTLLNDQFKRLAGQII